MRPFTVQILDDDILESVEVIDVFLECEAGENCYAPQNRYTITIVDNEDGTFYITVRPCLRGWMFKRVLRGLEA